MALGTDRLTNFRHTTFQLGDAYFLPDRAKAKNFDNIEVLTTIEQMYLLPAEHVNIIVLNLQIVKLGP